MAAAVYEFEGFRLDCGRFELLRNGRAVRLERKPMELLILLVAGRGQLVTRDEIAERLWSSKVFVDTEHGINTAIRKIRQVLGDDPENPRFIETVPAKGYRFSATVFPPLQIEQEPANADAVSPPVPEPRRRWIPAVFALILLVVVGTLFLVRRGDRRLGDGSARANQDLNRDQDLHAVPLTTLPGQETSPAFSPDGSQVAFAWDGGNGSATNPFNLYVKVIGSENVEQLTHEPAEWIVPAWSPDGSTIAFARKGGNRPGIFSVPARGGAERKLADADFYYPESMSLSWSSDGRQLLYYAGNGLRS
ncbi:MAG TPA: winged helix-turn-helix domain-containing protein [Silvibacterium sp.]|nr:winged helix-turn-helix domain-containing protein [Silvibacterium sp.]